MNIKSPTVFVTYSWDDEDHIAYVSSFTDFLRKNGFDAKNDKYLSQEETAINFNKMMYTNILNSDKVIIFLSEGYKKKADAFKSGVGHEFELIMRDIVNKSFKYVLVCKDKRTEDIIPLFFTDRHIVSLKEDSVNNYQELFSKLKGEKTLEFSPLGNLPKIKKEKVKPFILESQCNIFGLPSENNIFSGRKNELNTIVTRLKTASVLIIRGLGGMGKTQLAKEYTYLHKESYESIFWISASNIQQLNNQFVRIANYLNLLVKEDDQELTKEIIKNHFNNSSNNLLVIDNADQIELNTLQDYFPQFNTKIIITTRNSTWESERFFTLDIKDFSVQDSEMFLYEHTTSRKQEPTDKQDCLDLAHLLNFFPLALEHARAYINKRKISFKNYIELFNQYRLKIMSNTLNDYTNTVLTTWEISFRHVVEKNEYSFVFLGESSFLYSNNIPFKDIFLGSGKYERIELDEIFDALLSYSLINIEHEHIHIHSIIQEVVRNKLIESKQYNNTLQTILCILCEIYPNSIKNIEDKSKTDRLIIHVEHILSFFENSNIELKEIYIELAMKVGKAHYSYGNYNAALKNFNVGMEISKKINSKLGIANALSSIGITILYSSGKSDKALETLLSALEVAREIPNQILVSQNLGNIGLAYKYLGKLNDAMKHFQGALSIAEDIENIYLQLNHLSNIGIIYKSNKNHPDAIAYFEKALSLSIELADEKLQGNQYGNIGGVYQERYEKSYDLVDFKKAVEYLSKTLEISRKLNDKRSEQISLDHIGSIYTSKKDFNMALKYLNEALEISKQINYKYGQANTLLNIGVLYLSIDKELSIPFLKKALDLSKQIGHKRAQELCAIYLGQLGFEN